MEKKKNRILLKIVSPYQMGLSSEDLSLASSSKITFSMTKMVKISIIYEKYSKLTEDLWSEFDPIATKLC